MKKILIVEDESLLAKAVSIQLTGSGYETFIANDGKDGLQKASEIKPDIILLDIVMPVMDGFETLTNLKKDPELKDIPVMILSNLGQDEEIEKAKQLGAEEFFVKSDNNLDAITRKVSELAK